MPAAGMINGRATVRPRRLCSAFEFRTTRTSIRARTRVWRQRRAQAGAPRGVARGAEVSGDVGASVLPCLRLQYLIMSLPKSPMSSG
jgi:hypothetical protein